MHRPQEQVRDFHRACGLRNPETPSRQDLYMWLKEDEDVGLRCKLIEEELIELMAATAAGDVVETVDALCDLLYVVYGCAVSMGIDLEPYFEEVHRTNMNKASGPKREDGKQLKPEGWKGPDIRGMMHEAGLL